MIIDDFLLADYQLKAHYLSNHYTRMLTRFSYFLTIDAALLAFVARPAFVDEDTSFSFASPLFGVGMLISLIWIYFGWMDTYLALVYRDQVRLAYYLLERKLSGSSLPKGVEEKYYPAGEVERESYTSNLEGKTAKKIRHLFQVTHSTTFMAAILPIVFLLLWAGVLIL